MNKLEIERKAPKAPNARMECCVDTECDSGLRNNYFTGKRLTPASFQVEQAYLVERRRLLNRAMHGWGVVYGFPVDMAVPNQCRNETVSGRLQIGPGFAFDELGRELLQTETILVEFGDVILLDEHGARVPRARDCDPDDSKKDGYGKGCWLLSAHYAEQRVAPVTIRDPCSCDRREWDQVCERVRYSLQRIDCKACCAEPECELRCSCTSDPCCNERFRTNGSEPRPGHNDSGTKILRGGCRCLCDYVTSLHPGVEGGSLCEIDEACAQIRVDLRHGVPLACVALVRDECEKWSFDPRIESCGPRRLVKRNDLLFDLIRGCDLTQISKISWGEWHRREIDFQTFADHFGVSEGEGRNLTKFTVTFSKPVKRETVKADCFAMTATFHEKEGGWREPLRVPIVDVYAEENNGLTESVTLIVRTRFVNDAIRGDETRFDTFGARVEVEIRGDYILDCNGQAVDANAVGLRDVPTGNGTPGGTYVSAFRVMKRETSPEKSAY